MKITVIDPKSVTSTRELVSALQDAGADAALVDFARQGQAINPSNTSPAVDLPKLITPARGKPTPYPGHKKARR